MTNQQAQDKFNQLIEIANTRIFSCAMNGSLINQFLKKSDSNSIDKLDENFDKEHLKVCVEAAEELEGRIRSGESLHQAVTGMRLDLWLDKIAGIEE